jgi:hypothetical protein
MWWIIGTIAATVVVVIVIAFVPNARRALSRHGGRGTTECPHCHRSIQEPPGRRSGGGAPYLLQVRLTITASDFGVFPEPELLVWLRAVSTGSVPHPGKALVVQPVELIHLAEQRMRTVPGLEFVEERTRTFRAVELRVPAERVGALVGIFDSLGFPGRHLEIEEDSGDPEIVWSAGATLEVELDDASGRVVIGLGPRGVCGRDAAAVRNVCRALFECAGVRSIWSGLLAGRAETGA